MSARPYTPTREDPEVLDSRTVGSTGIVDRIVERLRVAGTSANRAHTLVVGPRGAGKTHALAVALHRARRESWARALTIVQVPEDGIGIVSHATLVRWIATQLGVTASPTADVTTIEASTREALGDTTLVLVVENLDRLFSNLGRTGQHDLRGWVETSRILVVASTPLLFDDIQNRDLPWFGSFTAEHLGELTALEGADLITRLRPDDADLSSFLDSDRGRARLAALHQLTGGSPRLWTILAEVVSVERLDELVPAVEGLLEELVAYYQQRLWDLSPAQQRLVTALAIGAASRTATDLADELGMGQREVATTLGRLQEARWVRGRKVDGTDQRSTYYELREPLLRHYFQYRTGSHSDELTLIVEMLLHWFDPQARTAKLAEVASGSLAERYLARALSIDSPRSDDDGPEDRDPVRLLAEVRQWIVDDDCAEPDRTAAMVVEQILVGLGVGDGARSLTNEWPSVVDAAVDAAAGMDLVERIQTALDACGDANGDPVRQRLAWFAAVWIRRWLAESSLERLVDLIGSVASGTTLAVDVAHEHALLCAVASPSAALDELRDVVQHRTIHRGPHHPDTLTARLDLAFVYVQTGDDAAALRIGCEVARATRHRTQSRKLAAWIVASTATSLIRGGRTGEVPAEARVGVVGLLLDAAEGSHVALAQLPAELRAIVSQAPPG